MSTFPFKMIRSSAITVLFIAFSLNGMAQSVHGVNYQAILRDTQGDALANQSVTLLFNVFQSLPSGSPVFSDLHSTSTNEHGLVSVVIGTGATTGNLSTLDYTAYLYYMQVSVNGVALPAQKLQAVPMAYKATDMKLRDLTDVGTGAASIGQVLQWNGLNWTPANVAGGGGPWTVVGNTINYTPGNVGVGTSTPQQRLHVHETTTTPAVMELSNSTTGSTSLDGFQLRVESNGEVQLRQRENFPLSLWTSDLQRVNILANGRVGINTNSMIGAADLVVRSLNNTGYGGMYIESPSSTNGQPFYGYATNGSGRAWHYFDEATDQWRLYNNGERLAVTNGGTMALGTITPDANALLHLNSTTKGFLLPRMTTAQRNSITPATEGLMVFDTDLARTIQVQGGTWQTLGGTGGGTSPWTANTGFGIEYTANRVGIGNNASPFSSLSITTGGSTPIGVTISNNYASSLNTYGISATVGSTGTGVRYGLHGNAFAPSGSSASTYGVYGTAGASSSASNVYGVYGLASSTAGGNGYGVYGRANGANTGVYGYAPDANGIAIRGVADQSNGYAAQFDGDVKVNGTTSQLYMGDHFTFFNYSTNGAPRMEMENVGGTATVDLTAQYVANGGARLLLKDDGGTPRIIMQVQTNDRGRVITDELEIKGGADLAEHFAVTIPEHMELLPGMLVSIASEGTGDLVATTSAYDRRVAGVVSGANGVRPGLTLRQEGAVADGEVPVALTGRVYVLADAENSAIAPGDLLTSGDRSGYAMKATDRERAFGAVIGKAMTSLENGTGYVLVLVNLQ